MNDNFNIAKKAKGDEYLKKENFSKLKSNYKNLYPNPRHVNEI